MIGLATAAVGGGFIGTANAATPADASQLDWSNATLELADLGTRCPAGPVTFQNGYAQVDTGAVRPSEFFQGEVKLGDVNRDGRRDAVLSVTCWPNGDSRTALTATYAYSVQQGAPALLGAVTLPPVTPESYQVRDGAIAVTARPDRDEASAPVDFTFRWDGKAFQERSGKAVYTYGWSSTPFAVPFKGAAAAMTGSDGSALRPCPKITADLVSHGGYDRQGEYVSADDFVYSIDVSKFGDVNRDGVTDALVTVTCMDNQNGIQPNSWNYVYTMRHGKPALLSYLTGSGSGGEFNTAIDNVTLAPGKVTLTQAAGGYEKQLERTFRWTHRGLKAQQPLPGFPNVDVAP